jgi:hypothetical protein
MLLEIRNIFKLTVLQKPVHRDAVAPSAAAWWRQQQQLLLSLHVA